MLLPNGFAVHREQEEEEDTVCKTGALIEEQRNQQ